MAKNDEEYINDSERILVLTDVDEIPVASIISSLFGYAKKNKKPIYIVINTFGGCQYDMYALYDTIKYLQSLGIEVNTIGIGKIMSAGVLLFAAGSVRKIGRNATIMCHYGRSESNGDIFEMQTELEESVRVENKYNKLLSENSKMTMEQVEKMIQDRTNVYFTAEKAIELGIADCYLECGTNEEKSTNKKTTKKTARRKR